MICSADWHLRRTPPRARTDNWLEALERKVRFILRLAQESPPLLIAGDLFDKAKAGPFMEQWIIGLLRGYEVVPIVVPGQHDLPYHSLAEIPDSSIGVLAQAGVIDLLIDPKSFFILEGEPPNRMPSISGCPYGTDPPKMLPSGEDLYHVLLWHHMVINQPLWPGQVADKAHLILKKYKQFDLIVTGDNHQSFAIADESNPPRFIVNPGSMMRLKTSQADHKPCVYRWENGRVQGILLPIEPDVLDLTQIEEEKARDERIAAFVDKLGLEREVGLSYTENLKRFFAENEVDPEVKELVWRCVDGQG